MNTLSPIESLALSKLPKVAKAQREKVEPGKYSGRLTLDVDYDVTVGEDYEQEQANKIPWMQLAAVLFSKLNDATMLSVMKEALDDSLDVNETKEEAEIAIAQIMGKTRMGHKGKVTGKATVVAVNPDRKLVS